jgi:arylsulfatase B/arylsulfatase I/J
MQGGVRGIGFVTGGANIGITKRGYENHALMHVSDWLPTLCEACGCKLNGTKPLDGVSAWQAITTNGTSLRTEIVHDIDMNPPVPCTLYTV